jgi:cysteine synthase
MNSNILESISNTSLVKLQRIVPPNCASIFAKLEWQNPTGSMKDRTALGLVCLQERLREATSRRQSGLKYMSTDLYGDE